MMGGDEYLDGYSIYTSPNGYKHLVTYGMSELYANEEAQENEFSKWGYEMTIKLPVETSEECQWAISMMSNLARYTFTQERWRKYNPRKTGLYAAGWYHRTGITSNKSRSVKSIGINRVNEKG